MDFWINRKTIIEGSNKLLEHVLVKFRKANVNETTALYDLCVQILVYTQFLGGSHQSHPIFYNISVLCVRFRTVGLHTH